MEEHKELAHIRGLIASKIHKALMKEDCHNRDQEEDSDTKK